MIMLQSSKTSLEGLGNGRLREMELEDAETEVCRLEQEARSALEENKRCCKDPSTRKVYIEHHCKLYIVLSRLTMFVLFKL